MPAPTGSGIQIHAAAGTESLTIFRAQVLDRNVDEHRFPHLGGEIEHEPVVKDHSVLSSQLVIGSPAPADGPQRAPEVDRERLQTAVALTGAAAPENHAEVEIVA